MFARSSANDRPSLPASVPALHSVVQDILLAADDLPMLERLAALLKPLPVQLLQSSLPDARDPLNVLSPDANSLGFLYFLNARLLLADRDNPALLLTALDFSVRFSPRQLTLAPDQIAAFGVNLSRFADSKLSKPSCAILPIRNMIERLPFAAACLTPLQPILFRSCLLAKNYRAALPILDTDISEIPSIPQLKVQDFLLHHYYGAMLYIGLKKLDRAFEFLVLCISTPAQVCSKIQIEAYKKYVFVSLLLHGKLIALPKHTSGAVSRAMKIYCTEYTDFVAAFESTPSVSRVQTELNKHADVFLKDRNLGLAKQCVQFLIRKNIQQLTQTYLTLSLSDIAKSVGLDPDEEDVDMVESTGKEAERLILRMIEEGQVFATISMKDGGMVSFHDQPAKFDDEDTMEKWHAEVASVINVTAEIQKLDQSILVSKEYINKTVVAERSVPPGSTNSLNLGGGASASGVAGYLLDDDVYAEPGDMNF